MPLTMRQQRMTDAQKTQAKQWYAEGYSSKSIAEELGFAENTVYVLVKNRSKSKKPEPVATPTADKPAQVVQVSYREQVAKLYTENPSISAKEAAKIAGCSVSTAHGYLQQVRPRKHQGAVDLTDELLKQVAGLYMPPKYLNVAAIADLLKMPRATIKEAVKVAEEKGLIV